MVSDFGYWPLAVVCELAHEKKDMSLTQKATALTTQKVFLRFLFCG